MRGQCSGLSTQNNCQLRDTWDAASASGGDAAVCVYKRNNRRHRPAAGAEPPRGCREAALRGEESVAYSVVTQRNGKTRFKSGCRPRWVQHKILAESSRTGARVRADTLADGPREYPSLPDRRAPRAPRMSTPKRQAAPAEKGDAAGCEAARVRVRRNEGTEQRLTALQDSLQIIRSGSKGLARAAESAERLTIFLRESKARNNKPWGFNHSLMMF